MIASRLRAVLLAATLATVAVLAVAAETHASNYQTSGGETLTGTPGAGGLRSESLAVRRLRSARAAVRAEFGTGSTAACVLRIADRETGGTYNPHASNWQDHHADGSRGSFGLMQIGALWRSDDETVDGFARRMFRLRENLRVAHRLVRSEGFAPWGGC